MEKKKLMYVDVIIPIYNAEKYLDECIESVLNQKYKYFNLILVNDGSKDNSLQICEKWAKVDRRIKVIHKKNGGLVSAWQAGLRVSSNDWVVFIDSDDWIEKNHLDNLVSNQMKTGADVVVTHMRQVGEGINEIIPFFVDEKCYFGEILKSELYPVMLNAGGFEKRGVPVSRCSKLIRKKLLLNNLKYTSEVTTFEEDLNIMFPVMMDAQSISLVGGINAAYCYRRVEGSMLHGYDKKMAKSIAHIYPTIRLACKEKNKEFFLSQVDFEYITAIIRSATNELQNPKGLKETKKQFKVLSEDSDYINGLSKINIKCFPFRFKIIIYILSNYNFISKNIMLPILVMAKKIKNR